MVRFPYDEQGRPVVQVELRLPAAVRREKLRSGLSLGRFGWIAVIGRDFLADMVLVCNGRNRTLSLELYR